MVVGDGKMAATKAPWCPVTATVEVFGGRWKPTILFQLKDQPRRFNELRRLVPGITQRMLTLQLRALERDGIVTRTDYKEVPPRVDYNLTPLGHSLSEALVPLGNWGTENMAEVTRVLAERETWSASAN